MRRMIWFGLLLSSAMLTAQDHGTYTYREWSRYGQNSPDSLAAVKNISPYYEVNYDSSRVTLVKVHSATDSLLRVIQYHYDEQNNTIGETLSDSRGNPVLETTFLEQPEDANLLQKVYGPDFTMHATHFFSRRFFDLAQRQVRYELFAVNGKMIAHVETQYNAAGKRILEMTQDDVHHQPLEKLVYDYSGEGRYILETFDSAGKMVSRMTLFHGNQLLTP